MSYFLYIVLVPLAGAFAIFSSGDTAGAMTPVLEHTAHEGLYDFFIGI